MQVGDLVKITSTGQRYPSYQQWADKYLDGEDIVGDYLETKDVGIITAIAGHNLHDPDDPRYDVLCGFKRLLDGKTFLMGKIGVKAANLQDVVDYVNRVT